MPLYIVFRHRQIRFLGELMKIALTTRNLGKGGIATFNLSLGKRLLQAGHEVTIVTSEHGRRWSELDGRGLKGDCLPVRRWHSVASYSAHLAEYFARGRFDIIVTNIGGRDWFGQLCLHRLPDHVPALTVLHNDVRGVYNLAAVAALSWNCAVGVGPKVQQVAAERLAPRPVLCIPNGIDVPTETQLRARPGWNLPLRLLYVGRLVGQQKGLLRLPAIVAECRRRGLDVRLTVIGDGEDRQSLEQAFAAADVTDWVEMRGFQPNPIALEAMREHHLLLLPSNREGLAIAPLEAQANGCVPIVSRLPGSSDVGVEEGVTGLLVQADDIGGYVDGIASFADAACWQAFSTAAAARARRLFSSEAMAGQYVRLFEELRQGKYPLPTPRSVLRQQGYSPFTWTDRLRLAGIHFIWRNHPKLAGVRSRVVRLRRKGIG
jgi:glycosyltransferase involved in cell wall biosynthesis